MVVGSCERSFQVRNYRDYPNNGGLGLLVFLEVLVVVGGTIA